MCRSFSYEINSFNVRKAGYSNFDSAWDAALLKALPTCIMILILFAIFSFVVAYCRAMEGLISEGSSSMQIKFNSK